jgi:hypothetical protein
MTVRLPVRNVVLGALFGLLVLLIWWVNRSDAVPFDPIAGLVLIALMFVAAGFSGGLFAGFVAGCVGALTLPGDYMLFKTFPFYDPMSFVMTMAVSATVVMLLVTLGAGIRRFVAARLSAGLAA